MDFEIPRRQILHKTLFSELILGVDVPFILLHTLSSRRLEYKRVYLNSGPGSDIPEVRYNDVLLGPALFW